jgi:hypothetical protein
MTEQHYVFVLVSHTAKGEKKARVFFNPEKYGAHKSTSRDFESPLWMAFEPPRGLKVDE